MKDQINKIMESEGLSPAKFADEIGVQRSSISHILSGRNKPSYDFIIKILSRFSGINAEWLLTGKGSMIKSSLNSTKSEPVHQSSLFDNPVKEVKEKEKYNETNPGFEKFINLSNAKQIEKNVISDRFDEFTNVNNAKYIVFFYEDGTFEKFKAR